MPRSSTAITTVEDMAQGDDHFRRRTSGHTTVLTPAGPASARGIAGTIPGHGGGAGSLSMRETTPELSRHRRSVGAISPPDLGGDFRPGGKSGTGGGPRRGPGSRYPGPPIPDGPGEACRWGLAADRGNRTVECAGRRDVIRAPGRGTMARDEVNTLLAIGRYVAAERGLPAPGGGGEPTGIDPRRGGRGPRREVDWKDYRRSTGPGRGDRRKLAWPEGQPVPPQASGWAPPDLIQ